MHHTPASNPKVPFMHRISSSLGKALLVFPSLLALSAAAAEFALQEAEPPVEATVPLAGTTLIALQGDRIRSAVFDRADMDVQTDSETGSVYVLPKRPGTAMIYLSAESGDTASVALTFSVDARPRAVILEKLASSTNALPTSSRRKEILPAVPLRADGHSAEMKRLITLVLHAGERDDGEPGRDYSDEIIRTDLTTGGPASTRVLKRLAPLRAHIDGVWQSETAEALRITLRNGTISPVLIDPQALALPGIWAVGLTASTLMPGDRAVLILTEATRHER